MSAPDLGGRFFIDTNIFVYSFDDSVEPKQRIAEQIIDSAIGTGAGVISTQVVQEFLNLALRKFEHPLTLAEARAYLQTTLIPLCSHRPTPDFYDRALSVQQETGYGFYDALIVTAALDLHCTTLLSEDLQHQRKIRGMIILNPFRA